MNHAQILALITALSGAPQTDPFAALRAEAGKPGAAVGIEACPRPLPVDEIEGVSLVCGRVKIPEERAKRDSKMLSLAFFILKAHSRFPEADPVVYLQGGPGDSALRQIPLLAKAFAPWRARRDIIAFDQRSAGFSGLSASCATMVSANSYDILRRDDGSKNLPAMTKECVTELERLGVPLAVYNTTQNALDVPLIVKALGYGDYNIYGISYGTKLALEVMRSAPKGVRSVIIDGVAPPWVNLYNSFGQKTDEAIQNVVDQCAADKVCNDAYPDLGRIFIEALNKAEKGEIFFHGEKQTIGTVVAPVVTRNGKYDSAPVTRYIPAYVYELWRGKDMPTVELLFEAKLDTPKPGDAAVLEAAGKLNAEQKELVQQLLDNAAIVARAEQGSARTVTALRDASENARALGPLARLFDQELSAALTDALRRDRSKVGAALGDYTAMRSAKPEKSVLQAFVDKHTAGRDRERLSALIAGMSDKELAGSFTIIRRDSLAGLFPFLYGMYLDIYACQEDVPFGSFEGYQAVNATLKYPHHAAMNDGMAKQIFDSCAHIKPQPRANWHTPVHSRIPTLSFGSLFDTQTPASWAKIAIERLSNAQAFMIPEAGHGAVLYQPCVAEMGVAFIDNPRRKFDNACAESIRIDWHIAPWVNEAKN